jgi:L-aspartate oxidase
MNNFSTPIIILGGGLAGLYCALKLAPLPVTLIAPSSVGTSGASYWAQGGIAAAVEEDDSPEKHAFDTIAAGAGLVDENIALGMAQEARNRIQELLEFGAPFDRTKQGVFLPSQEAAHSHRRIVRVKGDSAGRAIMETLKKKLDATPSINVIEGTTAYKISKHNSHTLSVFCLTSDEKSIEYRCACLILATGGIGHLYSLTTNPLDSCGAGVAMAAQVGAVIADAEFVQFHPTAIDIHTDPAPLATESLRGEGATIINRFGHRFLIDSDSRAELAPRDIVARKVYESIQEGSGAFLDAREKIGRDFPTRFPAVYASCIAAGINPINQPIPIAPAAHYHMGGILTDACGRTSIDHMWAIGEVASTGVHGANRLASNSLLEALVFADRVASDIKKRQITRSDYGVNLPKSNTPNIQSSAIITEIRENMSNHVGVIRNKQGLSLSLKRFATLYNKKKTPVVQNMLITAIFIAASALKRCESRGAHYRDDYPQENPTLASRTKMTLNQVLDIANSCI